MPRIHTLDIQRLTPLGHLIAEYMRQQWPRMTNKAEFARFVGIRPSTVDNLMYSQHAASSRTLNKIAHATGIPATKLYEAASGAYTPAPLPLPVARDPEERRQPPRIAEQQSSYTARDTYIRRIQGLHLDPATKQDLITMFLAALPAEPPSVPPPWDDHDVVSTLQLSTVTAPPVQPEQREQESQPACARS